LRSVPEEHLRQEIADICHLIYEKGYVASTDGNVSVRLADGSVMCTPTRCNKGFVKPTDLVVIPSLRRTMPC
jgi:L-fuculose-phosphate aldolase